MKMAIAFLLNLTMANSNSAQNYIKMKQKSKQKIVISASASFQDEILIWKSKLEQLGYKIIDWPMPIKNDKKFLRTYQTVHTNFYKNITKTDILLVLNLDKKGIKNYIGASVFAEIAFAIGLNISSAKKIKIYRLNHIPQNLPHSDELNLWKKLGWIRKWKKYIYK